MSDLLFISVPILIIVLIIYLVSQNNKKIAIKEAQDSIINKNGDMKQICFWCKQEINVGAKICPYCKKVPTKTGNDIRQIEIFIGIVLMIIGFLLLF